MIDWEGKDRINELIELAQRQERERLEFRALTEYSLEDFLRLYKMGKVKIQVSPITPGWHRISDYPCPHCGHPNTELTSKSIIPCVNCSRSIDISKETVEK